MPSQLPSPTYFTFCVFGQQLLTLTCCTSFLIHTGGANRTRCALTTSCDLDIGSRDEAQVVRVAQQMLLPSELLPRSFLSDIIISLPSFLVLEFDPGASQMLGKRSIMALIIIVLSVQVGTHVPQCSCRGKGQFGAISSLLSPLQRFQGLNAGCVPSAFTP